MNKLYKIAIAALCLSALSAAAVPARRGPVTVKQPDGTYITVCKTGDEFNHFTTTSDGILLTTNADGIYCYGRLSVSGVVESTGIKAVDAELRSTLPAEAVHFNMQEAMALRRASGLQRRASGNTALGRGEKTFPAMGDVNALILLVEYKDVKFTLDDPYRYFNDMLNKEGFSEYGGTGSCKDYFLDNSNGQFRPHFDVYGPITLSKNRSYYGGNVKGEDAAPREMVSEACELADKEIDFSRYDNDGDGYVDNVFVFYAGQGEADYGPADSVWPHSWNLNPSLTLDNVIISQYACSNEWQEDTPGGIGTFVHEFSHVMGLPDLYSTTYAYPLVCTPGGYSVLDYGPYNNDGRTPPSYSVFERNAMGWLVPEVLSEPANVTLGEIQESNKGYIIPTAKDTEFYLLENRQKKGWDAYLPGHGMLIWHVDYNATTWTQNTVNNDKSHQGVDLCEADGRDSKNQRTQGDAFPGSANVTRYQPRWWTGGTASIKLSGITETEGRISFAMEEAEAPGDYLSVYDVVNGTSNTTTNVKVRGYIVGYAKSTFTEKSVEFSAPATVESNIVLADSETETYYANCIPVQLMAASDARNALNLKTNPGMLGAYVELYGDLERYMLVNGLKSVREYTILSNGNVSIDEIETSADNNDNDNAEWFNLQGMRVSPESTSDGIYIRRTANSAEKVTIKR